MCHLSRKSSRVGTPTVGTPFVLCTMFGHENPGRRNVKNLTSLYGGGVDGF
jgi:hypothetical protein